MTFPVGFVGLGVLGSAIAPHLAAGGNEVRGYDIDGAALDSVREQGVTPVDSLAELGAACRIVFTCLPNLDALMAALDPDQGLLSAEFADQVVIDLSTLSVADKEAAAKLCDANGRLLLDCPVSGNRMMAQKRGLTAFLSGNQPVCDAVVPLLESFCRKVHYVGAFGCGIKTKLAGNILNLVHNTVAAEAMVLAIKSGLNPKLFHEVISGSGSSSAMFEVRGAMMANDKYDHEGMNFSVPIKDARIISDHAASLNCPTPLYHAALQTYYAAVAQGLGDLDAAAVCQVMEKNAGASR